MGASKKIEGKVGREHGTKINGEAPMCGLETQSHLTRAQGPAEIHLGFDELL